MLSTLNGCPLLRRTFAGCWTPAGILSGSFPSAACFWPDAVRKTVGRIAGIIDRHYNEFHGEKMGIWGFFECTDDPEAAAALFSAVETWVRQKGMTFIRGPLNPSPNYEAGLLIEGFDVSAGVGDDVQPAVLPEVG